jgi:hypothetical protein
MLATTPIKYVGKAPTWVDTAYGSNVEFKRNKISDVPNFAAPKLLRHPEFKDARPLVERGVAIVEQERPETEEERELRESIFLEQHVRVDTMSRKDLANYAMRGYGVHLDANDKTVDIVSEVRSLMRRRE